jgi:uncharacterized damage-inducible protein DinB
MKKTYRPGTIGVLTDEYEKAIEELKTVLKGISNKQFITVSKETVPGFSVKGIVLHILTCGFKYSNYIRKKLGNKITRSKISVSNIDEAILQLDKMFQHTLDTFEDQWSITYNQMLNTIIKTPWATYDMESMIEHAIVHVLRHRRQIEKLVGGK